MKTYVALFLSSLKSSTYYRSTLIANAFIWLFRVGVVIVLYSAAYGIIGRSINGMDFVRTAWSLAAYCIVVSFAIRHVAQDINQDIRLGAIETKLNKPANYLGMWIAQRAGMGIVQFLVITGVLVIGLAVTIGFPQGVLSPAWVGQSIAIFILGIWMMCLIYSAIGLSAVWIDDADPIFWIFDKSIMVLGGAFFPVALFPDIVRAIAEYTPFGGALFFSHVFNPDFSERWLFLLAAQALWCIALTIALGLMYRSAQRHLSVNGG